MYHSIFRQIQQCTRHLMTGIIVSCILSLFVFPAKVSARELYTTDGVNLRSGANSSSQAYFAVEAGTAVTQTGQSGNWIQVNVNGTTGYIYKDYLSEEYSPETISGDTSSDSPASVSETSYVNSTDVNLRKKANDHCKVKAVLTAGDSVTILGKNGNWTKIQTASGQKGYVFSIYLGEKSNASEPKQPSKSEVISDYRSGAISYGKNHLGDIYSQSLRDTEGYADCSSLVRDAFLNASGTFIGDTTVTQSDAMSNYLYSIDKITDVTPGDLVYHLSSDNHVGIYLGKGKVLHASQSAGVVKISTYDDNNPFWEYGCNAAAYCYDN